MRTSTVMMALVILGMGWGTGYRLAQMRARDAAAALRAKELSRSLAAVPPSEATPAASSSSLDQLQASAAHAAPATLPDTSVPVPTLGPGETGQHLAQLSAQVAFLSAPHTPEGAQAAEHLAWLMEHPQLAFAGIREGLPRLPLQSEDARIYLIQLAGKLDVEERGRTEWLAEQLRTPAPEARKFETVAALSALLQSAHDPEEIESALRGALSAQKDPRTRELLLSAYGAQEPQRAQRIKGEL